MKVRLIRLFPLICVGILWLVSVCSARDPLVVPGVESGTAVLLFQVEDDATNVWVLGTDGVQTSYRVSISRLDLHRRVAEFLALVGQPPSPSDQMQQYRQVLEYSLGLHDLLLSPAETKLSRYGNVVIVPSDVLWFLPFAALYRCPGCEGDRLAEGRFWIEDQAISLAHTLDAAFATIDLETATTLRSALVVSADPDRLDPGAWRETATVAQLLSGSTVISGAEATGAQVKEVVGQESFDVLHFTQGSLMLREDDPLLSAVCLRPGEDELLTIAEFLRMRVRVGLLALSGRTMPNERSTGTLPLVLDALRAAGVASMVFSIGPVDGQAAGWFMETLYRGLLAGESRAEALRQAQVTLLRGDVPMYRYPYYWAPFVLFGDWRRMAMPSLGDMEKLDYTLARLLADWKSRPHSPDEVPPTVAALVTLQRPATPADLEAFGELSRELELVGSFGAFVQVRIPLPLLEALAGLPQVRSISVLPETIRN